MAALPVMPGTEAPRPELGTLMGEMPRPAAAPADQVGQAVMSEVRGLMASVEALATQFPAASEPARAVKQGLVEMMVKIVASQREAESPAPRVLG